MEIAANYSPNSWRICPIALTISTEVRFSVLFITSINFPLFLNGKYWKWTQRKYFEMWVQSLSLALSRRLQNHFQCSSVIQALQSHLAINRVAWDVHDETMSLTSAITNDPIWWITIFVYQFDWFSSFTKTSFPWPRN